MRTFYTGSDIEDLAASGVRQLEVGPSVSLTDAARERAEELGIVLVTPGSAPTSKSRGTGCTREERVFAKQAARLSARTVACSESQPRLKPPQSGGPVVDQLVEAVSALKKRGG